MKVFFITHFVTLLINFITAFVISFLSVKPIVEMTHAKGLAALPNDRTSHNKPTATLGGIAIFGGFIFASLLFPPFGSLMEMRYIVAGVLLMFFIGMKDDIFVIAPLSKLGAQIVAAIIIVDFANIRLTSLHGFLGVTDLNYHCSLYLTIFVVVVIVNAFNLIDGIDGLAAGIGIVCSATFGVWFYLSGQFEFAFLTAALAGSLGGFLWFNLFGKKNKIFMGDTGSLVLGFLIAVFAIQFNQSNLEISGYYHITASPAVSFAILIIPLYDTIRVFIIRISRKQSPFKADKTHVHHKLLELGYSHAKATLILVLANIFFVILAFLLHGLGIIILMLIVLSLSTFFSAIPFLVLRKRYKKLSILENENKKKSKV
ncbi:MAG: undecaprenyl/decaprenyl-phosphate alpha-N-acetylglucosaminyl 1-phosphate transferase [Bacteroidetes bacterium]|nr:undecaprenyl/decaprenyl-phosphate alpha-N-acetylglucosaminyl 1-phosphate transferase [Bacteroidota bacterium]